MDDLQSRDTHQNNEIKKNLVYVELVENDKVGILLKTVGITVLYHIKFQMDVLPDNCNIRHISRIISVASLLILF